MICLHITGKSTDAGQATLMVKINCDCSNSGYFESFNWSRYNDTSTIILAGSLCGLGLLIRPTQVATLLAVLTHNNPVWHSLTHVYRTSWPETSEFAQDLHDEYSSWLLILYQDLHLCGVVFFLMMEAKDGYHCLPSLGPILFLLLRNVLMVQTIQWSPKLQWRKGKNINKS